MFLTVREVAEKLRVTEQCIYSLIDKKRLPHHRIGVGRGTIRVREEDLTDYLAGCRVENDGKPRRASRPKLKHLKRRT